MFNSHEEVENAIKPFITSKPKEFWFKSIFSLPERREAAIDEGGKYFWLIHNFWINFVFLSARRGWRSEKWWDTQVEASITHAQETFQ